MHERFAGTHKAAPSCPLLHAAVVPFCDGDVPDVGCDVAVDAVAAACKAATYGPPAGRHVLCYTACVNKAATLKCTSSGVWEALLDTVDP